MYVRVYFSQREQNMHKIDSALFHSKKKHYVYLWKGKFITVVVVAVFCWCVGRSLKRKQWKGETKWATGRDVHLAWVLLVILSFSARE